MNKTNKQTNKWNKQTLFYIDVWKFKKINSEMG